MEANLPFGSSERKSRPPRHAQSRGSAASPVRILGLCGLLSAVLSAAGGFLEVPLLLGIAGATMIVGNLYAIVGGRRTHRGRR